MRSLGFFALGLMAFASAPHAAVSERPALTPFEPGHSDIVLAARLNGRGPFRFLLDTGSTHTAMSAETAEAIGAPVVAKAAMGSAAGSRETLVVHVKSLEVGSMAVSNLLASVIELGEIPGGSTIDGVIGHDALGSLRYTIDFRQRRVVWAASDATDAARGSSVELQVSGGRFLIALPQRQSLLRLVPDSGAASLLLFAHTLGCPSRLCRRSSHSRRCPDTPTCVWQPFANYAWEACCSAMFRLWSPSATAPSRLRSMACCRCISLIL
jgi:Aspartyl protease